MTTDDLWDDVKKYIKGGGDLTIDQKAAMAIWYRRNLINIHLGNIHTCAPGFIITHEYQSGTAITLATRRLKECNAIKECFREIFDINPEELSLVVYDDDNFYFRGCRLKEDLRVIGLHVVGTIPFDRDSNVKFYTNNFSKFLFPKLYRNREGRLCNFRVTDTERTNLAVKMLLDNLSKVGHVTVPEKKLYSHLLLSAGVVKSFESGICQVATGEYVTQTICKECGDLTGQCRASVDHKEIVEMKHNLDYCDKCALKLLDCTDCDNEYACDQSKTPSTCSEFTLCDYDYEDESACECPLNFEV